MSLLGALRAAGGPEVAPFDARGPVVWVPVRHHSPACAFHLARVLREVRPRAVLVEGPRDATPLVPLIRRCTPPIALFTTFVDRRGDGPPRRTGAYYPLCEWSPEWVALRVAEELGAEARFVDLGWPEKVAADAPADAPATTPASLQAEPWYRHSALLAAACARAGARDAEDLWDGLFEAGFREADTATFFTGVLTWCALARHDAHVGPTELVREACMRAEVDDALAGGGPVVVVTGGFHTVALPATRPARPAPVRLARPDDAGVSLMRYHFVPLDRLNGYASGMAAPELRRRAWAGEDVAALLVEIGRDLRARLGAPSVADAVAAREQLARLGAFRGHRSPTREDLLDTVRSCFVKGTDDVEGVAVLAVARRLLTGDRAGVVPAEAGRPPLVLDFEREAAAARIELDGAEEREVTLDLYRSAGARRTSRLFWRLALLGVPFARRVRGPDWTAAEAAGRVQEAWRYRWHPAAESVLIEMSRYGASVGEAAGNRLLERLDTPDTEPAAAAARLVVEACRCGLHVEAAAALARVRALLAGDPGFASVVEAGEHLARLVVAADPLEASALVGLDEVRAEAWRRGAYLATGVGGVTEGGEDEVCARLAAWATSDGRALVEGAEALRGEVLRELGAAAPNPVVAGAASGLLYDDGELDGAALGERLAGWLRAADPALGARFARGVLTTARGAAWGERAVVGALHEALGVLDEDAFLRALPHLRLAFADLTPRATQRVAAVVADIAGAAPVAGLRLAVPEAELRVGLAADRTVGEALARDGLDG